MRFEDLADGFEEIMASASVLSRRLDELTDGRPPSPLVRSALLRGAEDLQAVVSRHTPFRRPVDVIVEEWNAVELVTLRERIETAGLAVAQRPHVWSDWVREVSLALEELFSAWALFRSAVER